MQVIPVIDLMHGQVVRGVGGRREQYRPIESVLAADARPTTVARALADGGFCETYVADLDAILGRQPAWEIYEQLIAAGLEPWVDAGVSSPQRARQLADFRTIGRGLAAVVAGLESAGDPGMLAEIFAIVGPARLIFSLDLKQGRL